MQTTKTHVSYAEFHEKLIESGLRAEDHALFKLKAVLHTRPSNLLLLQTHRPYYFRSNCSWITTDPWNRFVIA